MTTDPALTTQPSPIDTPAATKTRAPSQTSLPMMTSRSLRGWLGDRLVGREAVVGCRYEDLGPEPAVLADDHPPARIARPHV